MEKTMIYLLSYLAAISVVSIIVTTADKIKAIKNRRRIRERTLLILSALGGSVAMLITMLLIRHKTRHLKFMVGIPVIILAQAAVAFAVWRIFYA